jgi:DNA modification methylase
MSEYRILEGDCLDVLATLPGRSVQTCVTSPPYFGLRDYGTGTWQGGDEDCDHSTPRSRGDDIRPGDKQGTSAGSRPNTQRECRCGATRADSQIGLEETPEQYVANLVAVFREVRRVLRDDGTVWLNLGDSYAGSWGAQSRDVVGAAGSAQLAEGTPWTDSDSSASGSESISATQIKAHPKQTRTGSIPPGATYKPKDLIGVPWLVAFALRADGWYLRSDIIWAKPNPMPESVTDRPTKAHEYLFLLSKSRSYFYDADSIREDDSGSPAGNGFVGRQGGSERYGAELADLGSLGTAERWLPGGGRNKRSVWTVPTQPFPGAHFATFAPKLIEPCVLAGSHPISGTDHPAKATVLDPFSGAGTTGVVALRHDRDFIGIELNPDYAQMARNRIYDDGPLLNTMLGEDAA